MASQLSDLDFQRLQENLLELKNQNYNLTAQANKSKHALGEATTRCKVLEEALEKANRTLDKSKKASEVQQMIKENEALNLKLRFQEEQANEQNQAMMKELCSLVKRNEELEIQAKIQGVQGGQDVDIGVASRGDANDILSPAMQKLQLDLEDKSDEVSRLSREVEQKDSQIGQLVEDKAKYEQDVKNLQEEKSALLTEVQELRGNLSGAQDALHDLKDVEERIEAEHLKTIEDLKCQLAQHPPEKFKELEARNICLQNEVQQYKDQVEKEIHHSKALSSDLVNDRVQLEALQRLNEANNEAMARLELELAQAHQLCEKRKLLIDQMAQESQAQVDKLREMELHFKDRLKSQEALLQESVDKLEAELESRQSKSESVIADLKHQVSRMEKTKENEKLEALSSKDTEIASLEEQLSEAKCDINNKTDVIKQQEEEKLECDKLIEDLKSSIERLEAGEAAKSKELETQLELSNVQKVEFEEKCARLECEIRDLQEEKKVLERKGHGRLKDLKKELVKEQRRNEKLQEKLKDCFIDTESNHSDQTKELDADRSSISSWSLMSGQNERDRETSTPCQLSPALPSSLSETSLNNIEYINGNRPVMKSDGIKGQVGGHLPSSISLQQVTNSSSNIHHQMATSNSFHQGLSIKIPPNQVMSPELFGLNKMASENKMAAPAVNRDSETAVLLEKIASLQEEKWRLEENLNMLEQSGAAMAQDIVSKTNLIQFYCMESRRPQQVVNTTVASSPGSNKDKVKQFVGKLDRLVHSEQAELHNKEMQRMQQMLEETLTKNMFLQQNMDTMSQELVRLSKLVPT